jgi:hypothetical protein
MQTVISKTRKVRDTAREKVLVDLPQSDLNFFQLFADKMGWLVDKKQTLWDKYIQSSPQNVDLSDEEIMKEVRAVRYGKV